MNARARTGHVRAVDGGGGGVVAGLHRWIDGHESHVQAAVWLLLAHEVWPRRAEFLRACVNRSPDGVWWIDWSAARTAFDAGDLGCASTTELAVLNLGEASASSCGTRYHAPCAIASWPRAPERDRDQPDSLTGTTATDRTGGLS